MARRSEEILVRIETDLTAVLAPADVARNRGKSTRIPPGGLVSIGDGDPGEPEVCFSPLSYTYQHRIPIEIGVMSDDAGADLDAIIIKVGEWLDENRFLGGLVEFLDAEAPSPDPLEAPGTAVGRWADLVLVASYTTRNPLT